MNTRTRKRLALLAAAVWLAVCLAGAVAGRYQTPAADRAVKLEAAGLMQNWMDAVKEYKAEAGLALSPDDLHQTGMIGEPYTMITTTNGALEAKRTTANPDMAALMVQMLTEAGIGAGDTVGAGFSGSFPSLDLAVLAACQTMGIKCVYIASVGASTYGANQPELTFPDMACRLYQDGLLDTPPALVTPGGQDDCGLDMDQDLLAQIMERIRGYGVATMEQPNLEQNLQARMALYEQEGPIACFIGVGGNLTTTGLGEKEVGWGLIAPYTIQKAGKNDGLIQRYNLEGLPVIHLLNVKRLVADYGLAYDPEQLPELGEGAVYYTTQYPRWPALLGLAGGGAILILGVRKKEERK